MTQPTREELAREYVEFNHECTCDPIHPFHDDGVQCWFHMEDKEREVRCYLAGFDAGFARAVEMLHSAHDPNEHVGTQWADWLLKQQSKERGE